MDKSECCGGNGGGDPMPPMAQKMMKQGMAMKEKMMGEGFSLMEMCRRMTETVAQTAKIAGNATPEVQSLFDDWLKEIEAKITSIIRQEGYPALPALSEQLKISEESALYLVCRLIEKKKLKITGLEISE